MAILPRDRVQRAMLLVLAAFFAACLINPPYLDYQLMQQVPTALAIVVVAVVAGRFEMSRTSLALVAVFLALHTLGARYLYSYVPYDDWGERFLGLNLSDTFGWRRNHYDRAVHFCYGLLVAPAVRELEISSLRLRPAVASVLAVEFILATGALYEICEWLVAVAFDPEFADQFNGQQGDIFDAQKDMALAVAGAVVAVVAVSLAQWTSRSSLPHSPSPTARGPG